MSGRLIVNADDWGQDRRTTDCIHACVRAGGVSAVSAMVYMTDSDRAAALAREHGIDAGLHLNLTAPFTAAGCAAPLVERQRRVMAYLRSNRLAQLVFNPALVNAFEYVVRAQIEEYRRLFGVEPARLDGHHHMHLSANVRLQRLLPGGAVVRRNFSFQPGEKSVLNRTYRRFVDAGLKKRYRVMDYLFPLAPVDGSRLARVFALSREHAVEVETHPVNTAEYAFLTTGKHADWTADLRHVQPFPVVSVAHGAASRL